MSDKKRPGVGLGVCILKEGKHNITIFMLAEYESGELRVMKPDKMVEWSWFDWEHPPVPMFESEVNLYKQQFHPLKKES